ncbi:MAG: (d)CMP kinase, partial [Schleiferiaceae bacterium]|nr:(d)CMP kinase [Schleiferiaceae bacterium]
MKAVPSIWMIHGPTASGKTSLAIELAKALHCEILSCDARQVYRELRIGVARPSEAELAEVRHHGIASHSIHQPLTAVSYAAWAEPILR